MKILVVNLLRLGDVIATAPAVKAIKEKYPAAEIHMMTNSTFESASRHISGVDRIWKFERERLQGSCVEASRPMFEAYDWLQTFVDEVSGENFDLLFNFTHNRLSGWLCGLVAAKQKIGLVLDGSGAVSFGSAWIRHLNSQVDFDEPQAFNHTDIFIGAVAGTSMTKDLSFFDGLLRETKSGQNEVHELFLPLGKEPKTVVAFQISTSDSKKEWGDHNFVTLARLLYRQIPNLEIFVLGAPSERERITKFCAEFANEDLRVTPAILTLPGVISFLEMADVLVTGDTSIKHFAAASPTRVIELIVGSADAHRTGSWKSQDLLVSSRELCAPCGHSEACHRSTHACAISIHPKAIADLVDAVVKNEKIGKRNFELYDSINIFRVDRSEGLAQLLPLESDVLTDQSLALCLERSARRLSLELRDKTFDRSQFGSEVLKVRRAVQQRYSGVSTTELRHALSEGEVRLRHAEGILHSLQIQISNLRESIQDPNRQREMFASVIALRSRLQLNPWTRFVSEPLGQIVEDDRSASFIKYRRLSEAVKDLEIRLSLELKLVRSLEIEFEYLNENESNFKSST